MTTEEEAAIVYVYIQQRVNNTLIIIIIIIINVIEMNRLFFLALLKSFLQKSLSLSAKNYVQQLNGFMTVLLRIQLM